MLGSYGSGGGGWNGLFLFFFFFFNHGDVDGWGCVGVGVLSHLVGGIGEELCVIC